MCNVENKGQGKKPQNQIKTRDRHCKIGYIIKKKKKRWRQHCSTVLSMSVKPPLLKIPLQFRSEVCAGESWDEQPAAVQAVQEGTVSSGGVSCLCRWTECLHQCHSLSWLPRSYWCWCSMFLGRRNKMLQKFRRICQWKVLTLDVTASTNQTSTETTPSPFGYSFTQVDFSTLKSSLKWCCKQVPNWPSCYILHMDISASLPNPSESQTSHLLECSSECFN